MDTYFKKQIEYKLGGLSFKFDVANTLFSTFKIDAGSDLLLRATKLETPPTSILDLGCGYGTLGIVLAKTYPSTKVLMADKDLLAVRYAKSNSDLNSVPNVEVIGSVGIENIPKEKYDVIVSNIPAKIGDEAIEQEFILKPLELLSEKGSYWFVVVSGLNRLIPKIAARNKLKIKEVRKRSGYTVYRLAKGM